MLKLTVTDPVEFKNWTKSFGFLNLSVEY